MKWHWTSDVGYFHTGTVSICLDHLPHSKVDFLKFGIYIVFFSPLISTLICRAYNIYRTNVFFDVLCDSST